MVVKLGFPIVSGLITPKRGRIPWRRSSCLLNPFLHFSKIYACRGNKLSPIWTPVHDNHKGVNISMLMKHVLGRSVNWPTCQAIIIGWPHNQNVFLIIVLHGVCCQGSRVLNCLDSTFHCPRATALCQVEVLSSIQARGNQKLIFLGEQTLIIEH